MKYFITSSLLLFPLMLNAGDVLLSETFSGGQRNRQNLPQSAAWHSSIKMGGLITEHGAMRIAGATNSARHSVAYFAPREQPVLLTPGKTLALTFDFTPRSEIGEGLNAMRFGFFGAGSDGRTFEKDGDNPEDSEATGYVGCLHIQAAKPRLLLFKRQGPGRLLTNSQAYTLLRGGAAAGAISRDQTYKVEMKLAALQDGSVQIDARLSSAEADCSATYTDKSGALNSFGLVGFSLFNAVTDAEFSNITVTVSE